MTDNDNAGLDSSAKKSDSDNSTDASNEANNENLSTNTNSPQNSTAPFPKTNREKEFEDVMSALSKSMAQMGASLPSGAQNMLSQLSNAFKSASSGNSMAFAENTAVIANKMFASKNGSESNYPVNAAELDFYRNEVQKVNLWLDVWTDFEPNRDSRIKVLRPADWIDGSMPEWIRYSEPFMNAFSASTVSQVQQINEQFPGLDDLGDNDEGSVKPKLGLNIPGVGTTDMSFASVDAISDVIGVLNKQALSEIVASEVAKIAELTFSGSDLGLDLFKDDYVFVPYNINMFIESDEAPKNYRSYIVMREVLFTRFFHNVHWISGYIVSLIRKIVEGAQFDLPNMMEMAGDIENSQDLNQTMEKLSKKTPQDLIRFDEKQQNNVQDLQVILALLESWVDYIAFRAGSASLDNISQIIVHHNRRRHDSVSAEETLSKLIGIKVNHTLYNQAYDFWGKYFTHKTEGRALDNIWKHIDNLPKRVDKNSVQDFLNGWNDESSLHDWDSLLD